MLHRVRGAGVVDIQPFYRQSNRCARRDRRDRLLLRLRERSRVREVARSLRLSCFRPSEPRARQTARKPLGSRPTVLASWFLRREHAEDCTRKIPKSMYLYVDMSFVHRENIPETSYIPVSDSSRARSFRVTKKYRCVDNWCLNLFSQWVRHKQCSLARRGALVWDALVWDATFQELHRGLCNDGWWCGDSSIFQRRDTT